MLRQAGTAQHSLTHIHTQTVIASRVLSHHTPKLLNRQENHWVWLSLQPATAGQDRGRQNVKGDRRNKRVVLSSLFYLSATVPLLSSQEVRCFRELFKDTSPRKKGGVGNKGRSKGKCYLSQRWSLMSSQCPYETSTNWGIIRVTRWHGK